MTHRNANRRKSKPRKPHPDFPLFPHASGRWAKKVRGKFCYFGKVADDPEGKAALERWLDQKDDLLAGRTPRTKGNGLTIRDLLNRFLTAKHQRVESGELVRKSFLNYKRTADHIARCFGVERLVEDLDAADFGHLRAELTKHYGPVALGVEIGQVRSIFAYAWNCRLIKAPVPFSPDFKGPSRRVLRLARNGKGLRMFEAGELRTILEAVPVVFRAMTLLGVNCGLGNHDCAQLPITALDLTAGWIRYPRHKTGIERRCPLWPETVEALQAAIATRPKAADPQDADLVFIAPRGGRWIRLRENGVWVDGIGREFGRWLERLGPKRPGLNFYALRHTFETVAGGSRDQVAVNAIMGHAPAANDMSAVYRESIEDGRLVAVVEHVHTWLFG
jgi:integrase